MARTVENQQLKSRYAIREGDEVIGVADYLVNGDTITFTHTEVDPAKREGGVADYLVRAALEDVRQNTELRVVAQCSYVDAWLSRHEDFQDLQTR